MKELFWGAVEWVVKGIMLFIFIIVLVICLPIAIIGDMFSESKRRIKR